MVRNPILLLSFSEWRFGQYFHLNTIHLEGFPIRQYFRLKHSLIYLIGGSVGTITLPHLWRYWHHCWRVDVAVTGNTREKAATDYRWRHCPEKVSLKHSRVFVIYITIGKVGMFVSFIFDNKVDSFACNSNHCASCVKFRKYFEKRQCQKIRFKVLTLKSMRIFFF